MRPRRIVTLIAVVIVLIAGGVLAQRQRHNHPPYPASALHATMHVQFVTNSQAHVMMAPVNVPTAGKGDQLLVGTITWRKPPTAAGGFSIYVIDKRTRLKPLYMETTSQHVAAGGNSWDQDVSTKFSWLAGAGLIHLSDGDWTDAACDLELDNSSGLTSVTFLATFPKDDPGDVNTGLYATAPIDRSDLTVGLVFIGDDDQIYWAQRLM